MCQVGEPVKPVTTSTPSCAAARAVSFIALGGAPPHPLGIAVAPDLRREHALVALVDRIAHALADEVVADRPAAEPVALEQLAPAGRVAGVAHRLGDVEVIAPARQLEPVEAPLGALAGELVDRQVGPLPGEQRYGSCHLLFLPRSLTISSRTPAAAYSSATASSRPSSVTIRSSSCAAGDGYQGRAPELRRVDQPHRAARRRAGRVDHVGQRPPRRGQPGVQRQPGGRHERHVEVELVQELDRPAAGEHPHVLVELARAADDVHRLGDHLVGDRRRVGDERQLVRRVLHQPPGERQRGRGRVEEHGRAAGRASPPRARRSPPWRRPPARPAGSRRWRSAAACRSRGSRARRRGRAPPGPRARAARGRGAR